MRQLCKQCEHLSLLLSYTHATSLHIVLLLPRGYIREHNTMRVMLAHLLRVREQLLLHIL